MESFSDRLNNPASFICYRYTDKGAAFIPDLKNFKNLTELDISGNCLSQELSELSFLKYIKKFSASSSHLNTFWNFPKTLEYLNVSCNHIKNITETFLPKLVFLDISCNMITDLQSIIGLSSLKTLLCGYNMIRDLKFLESLPNLVEVDFEHNLISSVESMMVLLESEVLIFVIKNNPASRSEFVKILKEHYDGVVERNDVFCKDLPRAQSLKLRLAKKGFGESVSENTSFSKIRSKYINHVPEKDIIRESDEIHEVLMTEVEELRKILDENESQLEQLKTQHFPNKAYPNPQDIEKLLMHLHETERNKTILSSKILKLDNNENNYKSKYLLMCTTLKKIKNNYKELKLEIDKKYLEFENGELEKFRLDSDKKYLKIENKALKGEIAQITQKYLLHTSKNTYEMNKQVVKSSSSKTMCKSSMPKIKYMAKDSLIVSPMSNVSLSTVTQFTKRRDSLDKDNSRILRSMPTSKTKASSEKPLRSKKRSFQ